MGIFSKIGKGIKKAFKKVVGAFGKIAGSKWGKILMAAIAVFTMGTALIAGAGAFTSTAGTFMTKFVAGAKAFVGALASPVKAAKGLFGAGETAGAAGAAGAAGEAGAAAGATGAAAGEASAASQAAAAASEAAGATSVATSPVGVIAGAGDTAAVQAAQAGATAGTGTLGTMAPAASTASKAGGLLKTAAKGAYDFAKSPAGGQLLGNMVQGYAAGKQQEELLKAQEREARYSDEQWRDPAKLAQLHGAVRDFNVPGGYLSRAKRVSDFMQGRPFGSAPAGAGNPEDVYGRYVVGY